MTVRERRPRAPHDRLIISLAYALAWSALLVNRGFYWDDWTLVGQTPATLVQQFSELGLPWLAYLHASILALPLPGLMGHVLAFVTYLLATLALHAVLGRIPGVSRMDALVAAVAFAVLPVNYARIALIDLPYGLSLLAFLGATWFLIRFIEEGRAAARLAALVLFVCAFTTASMLVLYLAPIALGAWLLRRSGRLPIRSLLLAHLDFLALPAAYWLAKAALFPSSGVYEGYNALTARQLGQVPEAMLSIPIQVLIEPLGRAATVAGLLGLVIGAGVAVWLLRWSRADRESGLVPAAAIALVGVALIGLGVFPYLAVGRVPEIWDWSSRHQLLVPVGASLLAAAAVRAVRGAGPAGAGLGVAIGLLIGISIVADARTLVAYQLDWFKQTALIDAARSIPAVRTADHIRVVDRATSFNTLRRTYRFYEYNALFSLALGDTRRLVAERTTDPSGGDLDRFIDHPAYHMGGYVPTPVDLELEVSAADSAPGPLTTLELVWQEAIGSPQFDSGVSRLIDVKAVPVDSKAVPDDGSTPAP
jgi:hypothetical protein